ncbi:MAG: glycosyltransferase [Bacteroidota bacterium]
MIILHIVEPFATGIAVFVKSLTEAMPDDVHIIVHGERSQVMHASEVKKSFSKSNVRFIKWRSAQRAIDPYKDLLAFSELYKILTRLKRKNLVDAVHLHSSKSGLLGRIACKMAGITNVLYTPNGASFLSGKNKFIRFIYRQIERFGNGMGGKVVCCSESEYEEFLKLGIDASYINNGVGLADSKKILPVKDPKKFRIVTSGRISSQKDPLVFNSIAKYFEEFLDFEFIWVGEGERKNLLTASNITVTGWVHAAEVKELVSTADIYLSTSLYEGLSFGVLEALALQKPVLLSGCVGNTDVVKKGINGDLFDSHSEAVVKILKYYNNRDMLGVMGNYSGAICKTEFDANSNFQHYRQLYSRAIVGLKSKPYKWAFK